MRWLVVLALIASVAVVARAEGDVDESDVVVLGNDDFDAIVNAEELMLVEFYAPWCGHCKRLTPEYAKAATALRQVDPPVKLAKVDATVHGELASRFNVHGYPTLKVFRNGKPSDYNGPREADGIVNYMKKQVGPAAKPVESVAELEKYISSNNYFVAGFFQPGTPTALQSGFLLTANKMRDDYVFVKTTNADVLKKYNVESEGIIAFKVFDERQAKYTGKTSTKAIEEWVSQNALPIVGEFNATTADAYNKRGLPILKVYTKVDWGSNFRHTQYFINRVKDLAVSKREELLVALVDTTRGAHEIDSLGLKVGTEPIVLIEDEQTKYISPFEKFSADNVKKFYDSFDKGEAEKFVKSEKPPAKNDGPVKVVTGKTFNEIVKDDSKDVLIEFYAPWCGHCKSLEPKYNDLGKRFKKFNDKVTIAKIDATANDYPRDEFQVNGFPTIYFKPAKFGAKPIAYDGERDVDSMEKFVKKHAANKLKKKD